MTKLEKVDKLITLKKKGVELTEEYKESIIIQSKKYHYINHGNHEHSLILLSDRSIIVHGPLSRLKSYINLRKIDTNLIYKWPDIPDN